MNKDLLPIEAIVEKLNLPEEYVERLGPSGAKLKLELLDDVPLDEALLLGEALVLLGGAPP